MRLVLLLLFYAAALAGYLGVGVWTSDRALLLAEGALDRAIPYDARFALVYLAYFPLLFWMLLGLSRHPGFVRRLLVASGILVASFLVFLSYPTRIERPEPRAGEPWSSIVRWIQEVDPQSNALPSLHGSLTVLACACAVRQRIVPAWIGWSACAVVLYSALALRQHLVLDLGVGALLGGLAARFDRALEEAAA